MQEGRNVVMPMIDIPNFYNINPCGIEESLAMAVNAIAVEEANVAAFIDTKSKEIMTITEMFCVDNCNIAYVIDINKSINNTLEKIIQLHILYQLVLEAIDKIFSSTCNVDQQNSLLVSIALKQFESANMVYTETEKIKAALRDLKEHRENDFSTLTDINKHAEEALSRIITDKLLLQTELNKLMK